VLRARSRYAETGFELVDPRLEPRDHLRRDPRHARFESGALVGVGGEVRPHDEQLALQPQELVGERGVARMRPRETEHGDDLVDRAAGLWDEIGLGDPATVEETRGPVVTGPGVDARHAG
jgi:hypothetical protein